jgi:hypothetical protein
MLDSQRLIALLKGPDWYAHESAKELLDILNQGKRKRYKSMSAMADRHIEIIMECFNDEDSIRILKTWLSTYRLPLNPDRLKTFEQFHNRVGKLAIQNAESIRSY